MKLNKRQFMRSFRTPPSTTIETDGEYNIHLPSPRTEQNFEVFEIYGNVDPQTTTPSPYAPLKIKHVGIPNEGSKRRTLKLRIHGNNALGFSEFSSLCNASVPESIESHDSTHILFSPSTSSITELLGNRNIKFSKNTQYALRAIVSGDPEDGILYTPLAFAYSDGSIEPITSSDIYDETHARLCAISAYGKTLVGLYHYPRFSGRLRIEAEGFGIFEGVRDFSDPYEAFVGTTYEYSVSRPISCHEREDGSVRYCIMDLVKDKLNSMLELIDWRYDSPTVRSVTVSDTCTVATCLSSNNLYNKTPFDGRSNILKRKATAAELKLEPYCISYGNALPNYYISVPKQFSTTAEVKAHLKELATEYYIPYLNTRTGTYGFKKPTLSPNYTTIEVVSGELSPSKTVIKLKE
jgi:hypothetical protein